MLEVNDDIWNFHKTGHYIIIPTNGSVRNNGTAVMGRGLAFQAKTKFPKLEMELGDAIKLGNNVVVFHNYRLITFPVKHEWMEKADINLIKKSCVQLSNIIFTEATRLSFPIYIPHVGCGYGRLNWEDVKPILERCFDTKKIIICTM